MLRRLRLRLYQLLALAGIRIPASLLMRLARQNQVPALMEVPPATSVLVLAPHMDDETIGCGGALLQHVAAGAQVHVVYLTDGAQGFVPEQLAHLEASERVAVRRREAEQACDLLGVTGIHYLDMPDGRSQVDSAALDRLAAIVKQVSPELIYLPFVTDVHHDHGTCNALFLALCQRDAAMHSVVVCCYEVWTPLHPNSVVDITDQMDTKMAALACFESQLAMNNYLRSVEGLNAYRAINNHSKGFAEAYYRTTAGHYMTLIDHP